MLSLVKQVTFFDLDSKHIQKQIGKYDRIHFEKKVLNIDRLGEFAYVQHLNKDLLRFLEQ